MRGHSKLGVHTIAMVLTLGGLILAPVRLAAAQSQQSETVQRLVDELRAIVTQGEKRRAADPRFLDELKGLADKYDWPWRRVVFRERFRDGDYARDPSWVVAVGRFWVDAQLGLRTRVEPFTREQPPAQTQSDSQDLFGAVLRELARPKGDDQGSQDQRKAPSTPSEIFTNARIGNAFALRLRLRTVTDIPARIEFGPYQGPARKEGYRLVYHNREGSGPVFELVRLRPWGSSVIFALDRAPRLDDGRTHRILWTRDRTGAMKVGLDGKPLLSASDRGVSGPFDGLTIVNASGDYGIGAIAVSDMMPARR